MAGSHSPTPDGPDHDPDSIPEAIEVPLEDGGVDHAPRPGRPTVDDMGEWSFPASDPPATWNWEVEGGSSS
jgi:hypothetical protein